MREVKRERVAKATVENVGGDGTTPKKQPVKKVVKIGRNDPCPLRQRTEVEEMHLQGVSPRPVIRRPSDFSARRADMAEPCPPARHHLFALWFSGEHFFEI